MAVFPIFENLPFSWIKRSVDAKEIITDAANKLILSKSTLEDQSNEHDILGCMLRENRRLKDNGEDGLSKDEIIYQILTFLAAGYCPHETR